VEKTDIVSKERRTKDWVWSETLADKSKLCPQKRLSQSWHLKNPKKTWLNKHESNREERGREKGREREISREGVGVEENCCDLWFEKWTLIAPFLHTEFMSTLFVKYVCKFTFFHIKVETRNYQCLRHNSLVKRDERIIFASKLSILFRCTIYVLFTAATCFGHSIWPS